jgi:hypothetical protein
MTTPLTLDSNYSHGDNYRHNDTPRVDVIANYAPSMIPRSRWEVVAEFTRSATRDFVPNHGSEARETLFAIARLADWTTHIAGHSLDRRIVFDARNIDDFVKNGYPVAGAKRLHLIRHRLHRVAEELGYGDEIRRRSRRRPKSEPQRPYTTKEFADFKATGGTASTPQRQHNWMTVLSLGAGFALSTSEIFAVRPDDIVQDERGVVVTVRGDSARQIACLPEWEEEVLSIVRARHGADILLDLDSVPTDPATYLARSFARVAGARQIKFTVERLRSTWIVHHLNAGTRPQVIVRALGVVTTKPIERCLPYVTPITEAEYFSALRAVKP